MANLPEGMEEIVLGQISLDRRVSYSIDDLPLPSMCFSTFGASLTPQERYKLAKAIYPCAFYDPDTDSTWQLRDAGHDGFNVPLNAGYMILVEEKLGEGSQGATKAYHWDYARHWASDELWTL